MGSLLQGKAGWAVLALIALAFPLFAPNNYLISVATQAFIMAIAALGLNLITGYTGQFNLAHGAFMARRQQHPAIQDFSHASPLWPSRQSCRLLSRSPRRHSY